jgi:hypothetical protein
MLLLANHHHLLKYHLNECTCVGFSDLLNCITCFLLIIYQILSLGLARNETLTSEGRRRIDFRLVITDIRLQSHGGYVKFMEGEVALEQIFLRVA